MNDVHLNGFDLNLLRVFDALLEERSVTHAATRLALTQSAVSHALGRLRYLFKDDLFVRGMDGMQPTTRASDIGPRVRQALLDIQSAVTDVAFDPRATENIFTIGANDYVATVLLPDLVDRFRSQAPNATLQIRPIIDVDVVEELDAGRMDLVLSSFGRIPARFESEPLFVDDGVWVMRADHPAANEPMTAERAAELPGLIPTVASDAAESVDGFISQHGLERRASIAEAMAQEVDHGRWGAVTLPHLLAMPAMLKRSDMIAFLPRRIATLFARICPLAVVEPAAPVQPFEIAALWHGRLGERADLLWLRERLREAAQALPALADLKAAESAAPPPALASRGARPPVVSSRA